MSLESSRKYSYLLKSESIINKLRYIRLVVVSRYECDYEYDYREVISWTLSSFSR